MYYSERLGIAFIHIPKTAGTTITTALAAVDPSGYKKLQGESTKHQTAKDIREALGAETFDRLLSFSVVRNPFDRACSLYHYLRGRQSFRMEMSGISSFNEFIKLYRDPDSWLHSLHSSRQQTEFISGDDGSQIVRRILRFENLGRDFNEITDEIGVKSRLPIVNASGWSGNNYRSAYDEEAKRIVARRFSDDLDRLGYSF